MLNRNVTRYLASFVACFALCTHSFADCIRVSPNGTEFTNTCSYKVVVEWIDHGCAAEETADVKPASSPRRPHTAARRRGAAHRNWARTRRGVRRRRHRRVEHGPRDLAQERDQGALDRLPFRRSWLPRSSSWRRFARRCSRRLRYWLASSRC